MGQPTKRRGSHLLVVWNPPRICRWTAQRSSMWDMVESTWSSAHRTPTTMWRKRWDTPWPTHPSWCFATLQFDCVGLKECKQLIFGNSLLLFTLEAVVALLLSGGSALVEHPACPEQADLASIWRLAVIKFLAAQAEVNLVHLAQGLFGAPSPKPTTLLALRVPDLQARLDSCQLRKTLPQGASIGIDEKGEFKTAILKEYPPALCCALGTALCEAVQGYQLDPETESPPSDFCTVAARMECRDYGATMGRDFMGGWFSLEFILHRPQRYTLLFALRKKCLICMHICNDVWFFGYVKLQLKRGGK